MTAPQHAETTRRPEPVLTRAAVVTVISVLSALLVMVGAGSVSTWLDQHADAIAVAVLAVAPLVSGLLARRHVTAVTDPRDSAGRELVPSGSEVATSLDAAVVLAEADAIHPAA